MNKITLNRWYRGLVFCLALILLCGRYAISETGWRFENECDGIATFSRTIEGSSYQMFKATAMVEASMEQIGALLRDVPAIPWWMENVLYAEIIKTHTPNDIDLYLKMDLPWPTSDRDAVAQARAVFDPVACGTVTTTTLSSQPDYPEQPGLVRLPYLFQQYILNYKGPRQCELTLVLHMDPGGNLPAWAVNCQVGAIPAASLKKLRQLVQIDKYQAADDPFDQANLGFSRGIARALTARFTDEADLIEMVAADNRLIDLVMEKGGEKHPGKKVLPSILQAYLRHPSFEKKAALLIRPANLDRLIRDERLASEIAAEDDLVSMVLRERGITSPVIQKIAALVKDELN